MKPILPIIAALVALSACAEGGLLNQNVAHQGVNWHRIVTEDDRGRLRLWRDSLIAALRAARSGHEGELDMVGTLLQPDVALDQPALPIGNFRCRMIKMGAQSRQIPAFRISAPVPCAVERDGALLRFTVKNGLQRPTGILYSDTKDRQVFLGTPILGDELKAQVYGHDTTRDMVGIVERIGDHRWRMLLPLPHYESLFDIIEIATDTNR